MGQRQNQNEIVYGNDCLIGWPPGETPKYIYARFSGLVKCPDVPPDVFLQPPNDQVFKLTQLDLFPCNFIYWDPPWNVEFVIFDAPLRIWFQLRSIAPANLYFLSDTLGPPDEGQVYNNDYPACIPHLGSSGGIATATWRLETIGILSSLNIKTADDLFMEMRPLEDGKKVYKYCRLMDATNIKILYEPP